MNVTDLPFEVFCDIFKSFDSLCTLKALSQTCKKFEHIVTDLIVVISDSDECFQKNIKQFELKNFQHASIRKLSLEILSSLIRKYHHFIFNFSEEQCKDPALMDALKLTLKQLQHSQTYHTICINSKDFNNNPLIRSLLPKLNSPYTELYFPLVNAIEEYEDLRQLDNTNCYFSQLEVLTIGSLSFQLFKLKAPKLKTFNHSDFILDRTFSENVSTAKISYSEFFDNLEYSNLNCLEIIGTVDYSVLNKFSSVKILRIHGDNSSQSFELGHLNDLEELVITNCSKLNYLKNISALCERLKYLKLSNNRSLHQRISGIFESLSHADLKYTTIHEYPDTKLRKSTMSVRINVDGCANLNIIN